MESKLHNAQANLALLKAGTWKPELEMSRADVAYAQAQVQVTQTAIDLLTVKAPVEGQVLQVNVRVGEYAQAGPLASPLMLFGDVDTLRVRVDVDENEASRVRPGAKAEASVRGNPELKTALHFEYIEPYVIPKKSLTGESTERVDTRVLQVIYSFHRGDFPVYVGQQMDVFIDSSAVEKSGARSKNAGEVARSGK
jgi:multidrug resistance efflux pump